MSLGSALVGSYTALQGNQRANAELSIRQQEADQEAQKFQQWKTDQDQLNGLKNHLQYSANGVRDGADTFDTNPDEDPSDDAMAGKTPSAPPAAAVPTDNSAAGPTAAPAPSISGPSAVSSTAATPPADTSTGAPAVTSPATSPATPPASAAPAALPPAGGPAPTAPPPTPASATPSAPSDDNEVAPVTATAPARTPNPTAQTAPAAALPDIQKAVTPDVTRPASQYTQVLTDDGKVKWARSEDVQPRDAAKQMALTAHLYQTIDPIAGAELAQKAQAFASGDIDLQAKQYGQDVVKAAQTGDPQSVVNAINAHNPGVGHFALDTNADGSYSIAHYIQTQDGKWQQTGASVPVTNDVDPSSGKVINSAYNKLVSQALSYASPEAMRQQALDSFSQFKDTTQAILQEHQGKYFDAEAVNARANAGRTAALTPGEVAAQKLGNTKTAVELNQDRGIDLGGQPTAPPGTSGSADMGSYLQAQIPGLRITDGPRTAAQNANIDGTGVSGAPNSAHMQDRALDVGIPQGVAPNQYVAQIQAKLPPGATAVYEASNSQYSTGPHVHIQWKPGVQAPGSQSATQAPGGYAYSNQGQSYSQGGQPFMPPKEYSDHYDALAQATATYEAKTLEGIRSGMVQIPKGMDPMDYAHQEAQRYKRDALAEMPTAFQTRYAHDQGIATTPSGGGDNRQGPGAQGAPPAAAARPSAVPGAPAAPPMMQSGKGGPPVAPPPAATPQPVTPATAIPAAPTAAVSSTGGKGGGAPSAQQANHDRAVSQVWSHLYQAPYAQFHAQASRSRLYNTPVDPALVQALTPALRDPSFKDKITPEDYALLKQLTSGK